MNMVKETQHSSVINQWKASLICNLLSLNTGIGVGWVSPLIPQILSPEAPIGPVTLDQTAWLAGIFPLGAIFFSPLVAFISHRYGRKSCIMISEIPFILNAVIVLTTRNINYFLIGRFIMGFGIFGCLGNTTAYVGEIAESKIRGKLCSLYAVGFTVGVTLAYISGGYFSYKITAWVTISVAVLNIVACLFIPETPVFLVGKGEIKKAAQGLAWLRRLDINDERIKSEIANYQVAAGDKRLSTREMLKIIIHDKALRKVFLLCNGLCVLQNYMGMFAVHGYTVTIFREGGVTELSAETCAVIYGCIQTSGTMSATLFIDRWGRKILMTISASGVAISMFTIGTYFYLKSMDYNVTPYGLISVVALCFSVYMYSCGAAGIPFIYISDVFTSDVRVLATMFTLQTTLLNNFILLRFFAPLSANIGVHNVFYIFGSICIVAVLYTIFLLPETKGKSNNEILDSMR